MMNYKYLVLLSIKLLICNYLLYSQDVIKDKTLVVWASLETLDQRSGSVLTIDDGFGHFDGIVFGEIEACKWMAGSNNFMRTKKEQDEYTDEKSGPDDQRNIGICPEKRFLPVSYHQPEPPQSPKQAGRLRKICSGIF